MVGLLKKGGLRPPFFFADLLTQAELCDDRAIAVDVLLGKIVQKASALTDHHQKAAAGMVVVLVDAKVLGELVDPGGPGWVAYCSMIAVFSSLRIIVCFHLSKYFPVSKLWVW